MPQLPELGPRGNVGFELSTDQEEKNKHPAVAVCISQCAIRLHDFYADSE